MTATATVLALPGSTTRSPTQTTARAWEAVAVVSVTDGDTIRVRLADGRVEPVRYIGIDAPETVDPRTTVECFGREASAKNADYVEGRTVYLEKDVSERDRYNRLLRYVWVTGADGITRQVNEELVRFGYAAASSYPPDLRYQALFTEAQRTAQMNKAGLWGACAGVHQPLATPVVVVATRVPAAVASPAATAAGRAAPSGAYTCPVGYPIKGNQTSSSGGWIYHLPDGQYYTSTKPEECFATEADAQAAGYRRAKR